MTKKTRLILSILGGLLTALPWWGAPGPLLLISFVPLLLVEEDLGKEDGHLLSVLSFSFIFFFTWNAVVTWWLARIHFSGGMSVIILNASFMSLVFVLYAAIKKNTGGGAVIFLILWTGFEFLHHRGDLSWPWLSLGNGLAVNTGIVQWYEYTGMAGGTLWVLSVNAILFAGIRHYLQCRRVHGNIYPCLLRYRPVLAGTILLLLFVIVPPAISVYMLNSPAEKMNSYGILILQPVLDPYGNKYDGMSNTQRVDQLLLMAESKMHLEPDFIIAPETSVDSVWITGPGNGIIKRIEEFTGRYSGTGMVLGATTFSAVPGSGRSFTTREGDGGNLYEVQNSALYFDSGTFSGVYHKHFLANGVEQVPFQNVFNFLGRLSINMGGVSGSLKAGEGPGVLRSLPPEPLVFGILICFESSYGEYASRMVRKGAEIILVISNDGWFKNTGAYTQHLRLSQVRAIETRRDIVRAANTGISCHISSTGEITESLGWWEEGSLLVYPSANRELTFYARSGDYLGRSALFFSLLMILNLLSGIFRK
jgi:apolipoprotein N-acyltransferase